MEPVKVNFRTSLLVVNTSPISLADPITKFATPAGKPAASNNSNIAIADSGVLLAGFNTTVQPAANAGAIFLTIILDGKFHGVMAPTTPTACFFTSNLWLLGAGIVSP